MKDHVRKIDKALDVLDAELQTEQLECLLDGINDPEEFRYELYNLIEKRKERLLTAIQ